MNIRGKFVGMRKAGCALHVPWNIEPKPSYLNRPAVNLGEFVIVDGKPVKIEPKAGKIVVISPTALK